MPVTWLSYMAGISLFGSGPGPHHLIGVLLHAANTVLLFVLCRRLLYAQPPKSDIENHKSEISFPPLLLFLIAFWALHPQRVEAVAWIASRKELLWTFFALWGLLAWQRGRVILAYLCCALACMSKPTAMVFPFLAMLINPNPATNPHSPATSPHSPATIIRMLPLFVLAGVTGLIALYSQTHPAGMEAKDLFYAGWGERLINAVVAVGLDLAQMVVPVGLHLDYRAVPGGWPVDGGIGLGAFVLTAIAVAVSLKVLPSRLRGVVLWGLAWFLVALLPTLGLFGSFGEHARADRFLYVPMMFLPLAAARWWSIRSARPQPSTLNPQLFIGLYLVFILVQTVSLLFSYRTDAEAFARALACDPDHGRALAHVGEARCAAAYDPAATGLSRTALLDEGIALLRRSQRVRPRETTVGKLAYALMKRGKMADWQEIRTVCSGVADARGQALEALGTAELQARRWQVAADCLQRSIRAPKRFYSAEDARFKLALAWHNGGHCTEALRLFEELSRSPRTDIAARAERALSVLSQSPRALLFW